MAILVTGNGGDGVLMVVGLVTTVDNSGGLLLVPCVDEDICTVYCGWTCTVGHMWLGWCGWACVVKPTCMVLDGEVGLVWLGLCGWASTVGCWAYVVGLV